MHKLQYDDVGYGAVPWLLITSRVGDGRFVSLGSFRRMRKTAFSGERAAALPRAPPLVHRASIWSGSWHSSTDRGSVRIEFAARRLLDSILCAVQHWNRERDSCEGCGFLIGFVVVSSECECSGPGLVCPVPSTQCNIVKVC